MSIERIFKRRKWKLGELKRVVDGDDNVIYKKTKAYVDVTPTPVVHPRHLRKGTAS